MLLRFKIFVDAWVKVGVGLHPFVLIQENEANVY